jgi:hypothetical protein
MLTTLLSLLARHNHHIAHRPILHSLGSWFLVALLFVTAHCKKRCQVAAFPLSPSTNLHQIIFIHKAIRAHFKSSQMRDFLIKIKVIGNIGVFFTVKNIHKVAW